MKTSKRGSSPTVKRGLTIESTALLDSRAPAPITLLTDFGGADYYIGAVKGTILSINPAATIVDITHEIPPQDIEAAAFTLLACYQSFAPGTIHIVVVDPGVGSSRRAIVASAAGQVFVGPDNGVFSYVLDKESDHKTFHLTATEFFCQPLSATFHGRDVFAPVAAALSTGVSVESFGLEIRDEVRLASLKPKLLKNGKVKARIIHVDRFGNCVTNIDRSVLSKHEEENAKLIVNGKRIESFRESYVEGAPAKTLFAIWGSAGFLELSAQNRSAAKMLKTKRGDLVSLKFSKE